jgi:hypothetical protein
MGTPAFVCFFGSQVRRCRFVRDGGDEAVSEEAADDDDAETFQAPAPRRRLSSAEKKRRVSGFGRIRDAPMIPAPMKPSLVGVGESPAMVTTERVERTGGRQVGVDRLLGVGDVSGVP